MVFENNSKARWGWTDRTSSSNSRFDLSKRAELFFPGREINSKSFNYRLVQLKFSLSLSVSVCLSVCLSLSISVSLSPSLSLPPPLSLSLSLCLPLCVLMTVIDIRNNAAILIMNFFCTLVINNLIHISVFIH